MAKNSSAAAVRSSTEGSFAPGGLSSFLPPVRAAFYSLELEH